MGTWEIVHTPRAAMRASMSPPDSRLPKSRRASVRGLAISSTPLMKMLTGNSALGKGWLT